MKIGPPKQGVRWHPAYDPVHVRAIVEKKAKETLGDTAIDWIDVQPTGRNVGTREDTKIL